jgi:hypothetical protein
MELLSLIVYIIILLQHETIKGSGNMKRLKKNLVVCGRC